MNKRIVFFSLTLLFMMVIAACNGDDQESESSVYEQIYLLGVESGDIEDMDYEEWLASIQGEDGADGSDGADGVSVENSYINEDYHLIFELSDGSSIDAGLLDNMIDDITLDEDNTLVFSFLSGELIDIDLDMPSETAASAHLVLFVANDHVFNVQLVEDGEDAYSVDAPEIEGYIFDRYNHDYTDIEHDMLIEAHYEVKTYNIEFVGEDIDDLEGIQHGDSVTLPVPMKEGYSFSHWALGEGENAQPFYDQNPVESDLVLSAHFEPNTNTITFDPQGGEMPLFVQRKTGQSLSDIPAPEKEGYEFAGWYFDEDLEEPFDFDYMPAESITLYADWGSEGLVYTQVDEGYALSSYNPDVLGSDIRIPRRRISSDLMPYGEVVAIGESVFEGNEIIESVVIAPTIALIDRDAFSDASNLKTLTFDGTSSLEVIHFGAFNATALNSFTLPNSVIEIGNNAFINTESLEYFMITENSQLQTMGANVFLDAISLQSFYFPSTLETIGSNSFRGNESLSEVTFEEGIGLDEIPGGLFRNAGLTSIEIPNSVEEIGGNAFNFAELEYLYFEDSAQVHTLGNSAFSNTNLTHVELPVSVRLLGANVFSNSTLETLIMPQTEEDGLVELGSFGGYYDQFNGIDEDPVIYVPDDVIDLYSEDEHWGFRYTSLLAPLSEYDE